ncbi:MAG: hypothetical protein Fur0040_02320 [Sideroxydans sp.]
MGAAERACRAQELMDHQDCEFVQVKMSPGHTRMDICDLITSQDKYGLGRGVYLKAQAPLPPFHPHCRCRVMPRLDLTGRGKPRENALAAKSYLKTLEPWQAAQVAGSQYRLDQMLQGQDPLAVVSAGAREEYRIRTIGYVIDNVVMTDQKDYSLYSSEFADFFNGRKGSPSRFAVASLNEADMELFQCSEPVVWLSAVSLREHREKHPEVSIDDYRAIPEIIKNGQVWAGHSDRRYILLWIGGKPYRAAIKTDAAGKEVWFLSLVVSGKQKPPKGAVRIR